MTVPSVEHDKSCATKSDRKPDWFWFIAIVAILLQGGLLFIALFAPGLPYLVADSENVPLDSDRFLNTLSALTNAQYGEGTRIEVLKNGERYYAAELEAIRNARASIHLEAYIFSGGRVADEFLSAMEERARAGVAVRVVADAIGSHDLPDASIARLRAAGGRFAWYMPFRWYTWPRLNNRTHREILVVDGRVAFAGGSGWADHWARPMGKDRERWRDTMVRVEGPAVTGLQSVFSENWLEASGELLKGPDVFFFPPPAGGSRVLLIRSSPTTGRSTPARVLFQTLLAAAKRTIHITTPYFLPDRSLRDEIVRAIKKRGVHVQIITPGPGTDHMLTRRSSRRLFGPLLEAGAQIYEYEPSMIHAKILVVDSQWSVVGTTNMDARSFTLNDEVNLATPDPSVAQRLEQDFEQDLRQSKEVSLEEWRKRGIAERVHETLGGIFQRQQ